jgi:hypothetical protein
VRLEPNRRTTSGQVNHRIETKLKPDYTEVTETANPAGTSDVAWPAGTETGGRVRGRLVSGWHFTRHLLEMVVAMMAGMIILGAAIWALGEPPGYSNPLVEYGLMGASMSTPMVRGCVTGVTHGLTA